MKKYKYIILILSLIILISFYISWTIIVLKGYTNKLDNSVLEFFIDIRGEKGNFLYYFNRIITEFGYTYAVIAIVIILLIIFRCNMKSLVLGSGMGIAALFNESIKNAYKRERPDELIRWAVEHSHSYPSGHSNISTIVYGSIIYLILKSNINKKYKMIFVPITALIPILIYISRLMLSVHYFSDIIGGITNGLMFLTLSILIVEILEDKTNFDGLKPLIDKKLKREEKEALND
ncbi:MAG: phosphatase PAP2 family protein [Acholeplasmatales bacterium]|nr:phosphatase PAP2 family protein [Acholeplasmatales bacterium]